MGRGIEVIQDFEMQFANMAEIILSMAV